MIIVFSKLSEVTDACLKSTLMRCTAQNIYPLLEKWNYLPISTLREWKDLGRNVKKSLIFWEVIKICKEMKIKLENAALLDLLHHQMNGRGSWRVHMLLKEFGRDEPFNAENLQKSLHQSLSRLYNTVVTVNIYNGAVWCRIMITEYNPKKHLYQLNVSFIVYYPNLPIILIKFLKPPFLGIVQEELLDFLGFSGIKEMPLRGKHASSLATMALNHITKTKTTILLEPSRKRKVTDTWDDDVNIVYDKSNEKEKKDTIEKLLGQKELPILESFEISLSYPNNRNNFGGFNSKIQLTGSHVMEGLRDMIQTEKLDYPLPSYLSQLLILGKDHIFLGRN
ncbi:centromere protein N-B-like isoform X1 [Argonauta hians]